jgi:hypothetical protein
VKKNGRKNGNGNGITPAAGKELEWLREFLQGHGWQIQIDPVVESYVCVKTGERIVITPDKTTVSYNESPGGKTKEWWQRPVEKLCRACDRRPGQNSPGISDEQRPIWRAVARKLNVELPRDSAGP